MSQPNLLVELFVEELPPKALKKLGKAFADGLFQALQAQGLLAATSQVTAYASPRRLAAHISQVASKAEDKAVAQKLMPVSVALDAAGNATPALIKKLQSLGADASVLPQLKREHDGKTDVLFYDALVTGVELSAGLQSALQDTIAKLPIPKVMTYQLADGWNSVNFVRPAHGLVALHGEQVVPVQTLGLSAGNCTHGHRFEASQDPIVIQHADRYAEQLLEQGAVIASFAQRRAEIVQQLSQAAAQQGLQVIQDDDLLDEVTALVERPNVLLGQFEQEFLAVPQECLILTMKSNQKYFPLVDAQGKLSHQFLIVSNISPKDPSKVIDGNERVVRPRLADARFFFEQDRKKSLASRLDGLAKVVYHNQLGSQAQRNARVCALAKHIATLLAANTSDTKASDQDLVSEAALAAQLSKADLLTDMVGEFPELQGVMGRYYAQHEGLPDSVAFAIEDHYKPRFAGDALPRSQVGIAVALADKLETLVGLFSIGEKPTGDKDPYALRRQALGILRMLMESQCNISFSQLLQDALAQFPQAQADTLPALLAFCYDRLSVNLREQGASAQEVEAVLALQPEYLYQVAARLSAVQSFSHLAEAPALAAANKRVGNILKKVEGELPQQIDQALLQEAAEQQLASTLQAIKPQADALFEQGNYTESLKTLAALKAPVDNFFDHVMVNAEDAQLKANRLALLAALHSTMNRVADLSKLAS
jgi:glycyl-tRNA synthetase beta chain